MWSPITETACDFASMMSAYQIKEPTAPLQPGWKVQQTLHAS
jgi:hypothetical protein